MVTNIVLGVDPGLANCGWGVVSEEGSKHVLLDTGCITTSNKLEGMDRIGFIYKQLSSVIERYSCKVVSVEKLFMFKNVSSVMEVAQVIGVLKLLAFEKGLVYSEHTPLQVKVALTGYGRAEKAQVEKMVRTMLGIARAISPSHASDAVAIALTHFFTKKLVG